MYMYGFEIFWFYVGFPLLLCSLAIGGIFALLIGLSLLRYSIQDNKAIKRIEDEVGEEFNYLLMTNPPATDEEYLLMTLEADKQVLLRELEYYEKRLAEC